MNIPKNYFENLSVGRYREYLKLLPIIKHENTRIITTLILTFASLSFFGIFAINPTLSTIITLKKQLSDSQLVDEKLVTKINNLSSLQQQYSQLSPDLPTVLNAIPQSAQVPTLMGQVFAISKQLNVQIISLAVSDAQLTGGNPTQTAYPFSLKANDAYEALISFNK